jgi:hypothetical protein
MKIIDRRVRFEDRRHGIDIPKTPLKDNYSVTIMGDRRKTPDRRINNIEAEWVEEWVKEG